MADSCRHYINLPPLKLHRIIIRVRVLTCPEDGLRGSDEGRFKREVGWFSAFSMGFGDVGADVFIALGVAMLYAGGAAFIAFAVTAIAYVAISLSYAELAPAYPYAGGVHIYSLRAWNTLGSFIAGWAILLDYVLCLSLFATAAAGYFKFLIPQVKDLALQLGPITVGSLGAIAAAIVLLLVAMNYFGIKYSAGVVAGIVAFGLIIQSLVIILGFLTVFDPAKFASQFLMVGNPEPQEEVFYPPGLAFSESNFLFGLTIAMASYIGVESIAQAAEETRRPHRWIPRATLLCAVTVPLFVLLFSSLALGVTDWWRIAAAIENPVAALVSMYKIFGPELAVLVSFTAIILTTASSNTGLIGVTRLAASMGRLGLLPQWLYTIHRRYGTPTRAIIFFGVIGILLTLPGDIPFLASLYNFGASLSYIMLFLSLIILRNKEPHVYRPWKMKPTLHLKRRDRVYEIPLVSLIGLIIISVIFTLFLLLHSLGRVLGPVWMAAGVVGFYIYRRHFLKRPVKSVEEQTLAVPAGYLMRLTVLVRPREDPRTVEEALRHSLDKRFSLKLLSIVDPEIEDDVEEARLEAKKNLEEARRVLASRGFEVEHEVRVGSYDEVVDWEVEKGGSDFIVLLVRRFEKAVLEKESMLDSKIHSVFAKYPARVMLLRKPT
ncbi:putative amino acid permease YhdG [Candidatus Calditenuaceae archaeon HR02]|nr:putative amino acid permease YhdG [Candidatus Calditenuaceae archaeon HR02]